MSHLLHQRIAMVAEYQQLNMSQIAQIHSVTNSAAIVRYTQSPTANTQSTSQSNTTTLNT